MAERHISFEQLSDVMAFRVIVDGAADCYRALGLIHQRWPMVPGRFKDFISTPKRNGYQAVHTSVIHDAKCASKPDATGGCTSRASRAAEHWD